MKGLFQRGGRTGWLALVGVSLIVVVVIGWLTGPVESEQRPRVGVFLGVDPLERAAYARQAGTDELVVLATDTDWRVRAAAYEAMNKIDTLAAMPMRDTPIDEREDVLLSWLEHHQPGLLQDLCGVYARATHVRYGQPLIDRCMSCHTGRQPDPSFADTGCVTCHKKVHTQWSGTAHANSLSHVRLPTVDPATRQTGMYDHKDVKGLSCVACHAPDSETTLHSTSHPCVAAFTTTSCVTCHAKTGAQWEAWSQGPRMQPAVWPPGSIKRVEDLEPVSCVDCHMPEGQHLWGARRDIGLLRSGIVMKVQAAGGGEKSIMLQNLAGHSYPSGGIRRALRLYVRIDDEPEALIATLAEPAKDASLETKPQPALQPGEVRHYTLPIYTQSLQSRLVYVRNRFDADGYTLQIDAVDTGRAGHGDAHVR